MNNQRPRLTPMTDAEWRAYLGNLQVFSARNYARARGLVDSGLPGHACVWQRHAANRWQQLRALLDEGRR